MLHEFASILQGQRVEWIQLLAVILQAGSDGEHSIVESRENLHPGSSSNSERC